MVKLHTQPEVTNYEDVLSIIKTTFQHLLTKPGIILMTVLIGIVLWGPRGEPIFSPWFSQWIDPLPSQARWGQALFSFTTGLLLLVIIPLCIIRFRYHEPFENFGLGLGNKTLGIKLFLLLVGCCLPFFYFGAKDVGMQNEYPLLYKGLSGSEIKSIFTWQSFLLFEAVYIVFFFIIEFVYRGYLLFGLKDRFGLYAVLFQMLSYTAWHLTKPTAELIGTPLWGFAVAAVSLRVKSMWYVFAAHWLLNIFIDIMILHNKGVL